MADPNDPPADDTGGGDSMMTLLTSNKTPKPRTTKKIFKNDVMLLMHDDNAEANAANNGVGQKAKNFIMKIISEFGEDKVWCYNKHDNELSAASFPNVKDGAAIKAFLDHEIHENKHKNVGVFLKWESTAPHGKIKTTILPYLHTNGLCLNQAIFTSSAEEVTKIGDLCGVHPQTVQRNDLSKDLSVQMNHMMLMLPEEQHAELFTKHGRQPPETKPKLEIKVMIHHPSIAVKDTTITASCLKTMAPKRASFIIREMAQRMFAIGDIKFSPASLRYDDNVEGASEACRDLHIEQNEFLSSIAAIRIGGVSKDAMTVWKDDDQNEWTLKTKTLMIDNDIKAKTPRVEATNQTHLFGKWFIVMKKEGLKEINAWIDQNLVTEHQKAPTVFRETCANYPVPRKITAVNNDPACIQNLRPKNMTSERISQQSAPPGNAWRNGPPKTCRQTTQPAPTNCSNQMKADIVKDAKKTAEDICKQVVQEMHKMKTDQDEMKKCLTSAENKVDNIARQIAEAHNAIMHKLNSLPTNQPPPQQSTQPATHQPAQQQGPPCSAPGAMCNQMMPPTMPCHQHPSPQAPCTQSPHATPMQQSQCAQNAITHPTQATNDQTSYRQNAHQEQSQFCGQNCVRPGSDDTTMEERSPAPPFQNQKRGREQIAKTPPGHHAPSRYDNIDSARVNLFHMQGQRTNPPGQNHDKHASNEIRQEQQSPWSPKH